jgi:branched-chain amino acid transport system permease protein
VIVITIGSAVFALLIFQPMNNPRIPHLALAMAPIAAGLALDAIAGKIWVTQGLYAPSLIPDTPIHLGAAAIVPQHLLIIAATWLCMLGMWLLLERTAIGISVRAVAANQMAARLQGINVTWIVVVTFLLTGVVSGLGGALIGPLTGATTSIGGVWSIKGILAAVLGGLTTARGAVLGGVIVGLLEQFTTYYLSSQYSTIITMSILIAFLLLRPRGIIRSSEQARV